MRPTRRRNGAPHETRPHPPNITPERPDGQDDSSRPAIAAYDSMDSSGTPPRPDAKFSVLAYSGTASTAATVDRCTKTVRGVRGHAAAGNRSLPRGAIWKRFTWTAPSTMAIGARYTRLSVPPDVQRH